ncbi:hypothetical protein PLANTIT3_110034 [Plantibacter sp. T3]|nr:hypothetical protein PLANTIT3_110034 [Plantibacter sp. T3]
MTSHSWTAVAQALDTDASVTARTSVSKLWDVIYAPSVDCIEPDWALSVPTVCRPALR